MGLHCSFSYVWLLIPCCRAKRHHAPSVVVSPELFQLNGDRPLEDRSVCKNNPVYIDMVPDIDKNTNTYEVMPTKEEAGVVMANPLSEADTAAEDKEK